MAASYNAGRIRAQTGSDSSRFSLPSFRSSVFSVPASTRRQGTLDRASLVPILPLIASAIVVSTRSAASGWFVRFQRSVWKADSGLLAPHVWRIYVLCPHRTPASLTFWA